MEIDPDREVVIHIQGLSGPGSRDCGAVVCEMGGREGGE